MSNRRFYGDTSDSLQFQLSSYREIILALTNVLQNQFNRSVDSTRSTSIGGRFSASARNWCSEGCKINDSPQKDGNRDSDTKDETVQRGLYEGISSSLLNCFVCNQSMCDSKSFKKNIREDVLNSLRENTHLAEKKTLAELELIHVGIPNYRRCQHEQASYCNTCESMFFDKITGYRLNEEHRRLKQFLYPTCDYYCLRKFPSRIKWVEHCFAPDHLRKLQQIMVVKVVDEDWTRVEDENPILEITEDLQNRIPP
ncbi:hypothetical protein FQA39_LY02872 [Lamprigera yunnana]|nr:hypothetical protein FQA39_LY02872 [Lamprigera yunnana]